MFFKFKRGEQKTVEIEKARIAKELSDLKLRKALEEQDKILAMMGILRRSESS